MIDCVKTGRYLIMILSLNWGSTVPAGERPVAIVEVSILRSELMADDVFRLRGWSSSGRTLQATSYQVPPGPRATQPALPPSAPRRGPFAPGLPFETGAMPPGPAPRHLGHSIPGPPPGTLGLTYRRWTRAIPRTEHPRDAMLEVYHLPEGMTPRVEGMEGFVDQNGAWIFQTIDPLIPGIPNVRTVLVFDPAGFLVEDHVRWIRLIPDRIVELDYIPPNGTSRRLPRR